MKAATRLTGLIALIAPLLLAGWTGTAMAESDDPFALADDDEATPVVVFDNVVRLKLGAVSRNNFAFSKYTDLDDSGAWLNGDLFYTGLAGDRHSTWTIDLTDLGRKTRDLSLLFNTADLLRIDVHYQEISSRGNNTGRTPYTGTDTLTLPASWVPAVNAGGFVANPVSHRVANELLRRTLALSVSKMLDSGVNFGATATVGDRSGSKFQGMAIYSNAANPQAVILPVPVDEETAEWVLHLGYAGQRLIVDSRASFTAFDNHVNLVSWQNPYASGLGPSVDYPAGVGAYSPSPDYHMTAWSLASSFRASDRLRFTLEGMTSETTQQQPLQLYTANTLLGVATPLPVDTLTEPLKTNMLTVGMVVQPIDRGTIHLRYRFNERDNQIDRHAWQYVRGDGASQQPAEFALFNRPLKLQKDWYTVEGALRLPDRTRLSLTWDHEETLRNYASVTETEEDTLMFKVDPAATAQWQHRLELSVANLAGGTYEWSQSFFQELATDLIARIPDDQRWTNHPLLRQYHLANQNKTTFKWSSSYFPDDKWLIQGSVRGFDVSFDKSELGLTKARHINGNLNLHFVGSETYNSWIYVDYDADERLQTGRDFLGGLYKPANRVTPPLPEGSDPTRNYSIKQNGRSLTAGIGMAWHISDLWSVKTAYTWLRALEDYDVTTYGARDLTGTDFPTVKYVLHSLQSGVEYTLSDNLLITADHTWYRYHNNDWAYADLAIGDIDKLLTTGISNPNETVNLFQLGMNYRF